MVWGLGFCVLGCRVLGLEGEGFQVQGSGFGVLSDLESTPDFSRRVLGRITFYTCTK